VIYEDLSVPLFAIERREPDGSADTKALEPRFALNAFQGE